MTNAAKIMHILLLIVAIILGGWVWAQCVPWLLHGGSTDGASLLWSRSGVMLATLAAVLFGLPAMVLAACCGVMMRWTTALLVAAIALGAVAVATGPIQGLIWSFTATTDASPSLSVMYLGLAFEGVIWAVMVLAMALGFSRLATRGRAWMPAGWVDPTSQMSNWHFEPWRLITSMSASHNLNSLKSGGIVLILGTLLTWVLCRNNEPGQVVGALILGFGLASYTAQKLQPTRELSPALLAPFGSAIFSYLYTALTAGSNAAMLSAWYVDGLWTPAVALPIYYACAAVIGVLVGSAFGQPFALPTDSQTSDH